MLHDVSHDQSHAAVEAGAHDMRLPVLASTLAAARKDLDHAQAAIEAALAGNPDFEAVRRLQAREAGGMVAEPLVGMAPSSTAPSTAEALSLLLGRLENVPLFRALAGMRSARDLIEGGEALLAERREAQTARASPATVAAAHAVDPGPPGFADRARSASLVPAVGITAESARRAVAVAARAARDGAMRQLRPTPSAALPDAGHEPGDPLARIERLPPPGPPRRPLPRATVPRQDIAPPTLEPEPASSDLASPVCDHRGECSLTHSVEQTVDCAASFAADSPVKPAIDRQPRPERWAAPATFEEAQVEIVRADDPRAAGLGPSATIDRVALRLAPPSPAGRGAADPRWISVRDDEARGVLRRFLRALARDP